MFRQILGVSLILIGATADITLAINAAGAAHVDFWHYLMLSKFGIFVLELNYNVALTLLLPLISLTGMALLYLANTSGSTRRYSRNRQARLYR